MSEILQQLLSHYPVLSKLGGCGMGRHLAAVSG
jgi:hypothetical protein